MSLYLILLFLFHLGYAINFNQSYRLTSLEECRTEYNMFRYMVRIAASGILFLSILWLILFIIKFGKKESMEKDYIMCKICYTNEREIVLFPCAHYFCCKVCSRNFDKCPLCKIIITGYIKIYPS
jgi:hypothetical protein